MRWKLKKHRHVNGNVLEGNKIIFFYSENFNSNFKLSNKYPLSTFNSDFSNLFVGCNNRWKFVFCAKVSRSVGMMRRLSIFLPRKSLKCRVLFRFICMSLMSSNFWVRQILLSFIDLRDYWSKFQKSWVVTKLLMLFLP